MAYLFILLKAGESLVEVGHEVQRVVGQTPEAFGDAVCTTGNKNNHCDCVLNESGQMKSDAQKHFLRVSLL